jgi:hypothetical protein
VGILNSHAPGTRTRPQPGSAEPARSGLVPRAAPVEEELPAESQSFANDHPFLDGLVSAIRDGYDAIARRNVVDAKDMFAEYALIGTRR